MKKILFRGIMPALPTPFDKNEQLIRSAVAPLMEMQLAAGVNGFYVCGATGEGPVLPIKTRMEMAETAMSVSHGRGAIIEQIGGADFNDVMTLTRHAQAIGVDAISAMAPNAYFAHTSAELVDYYKAIAALTDRPLLVYVTPLMLGSNLPAIFEQLMDVPNIIGLKFTLKDYFLMSKLKMIRGGDINIINGPDEMLLAGLSMGADGGIGSTYNLMPDRFVQLYQAFEAGDLARAQQIQYSINRVVDALIELSDGCSVMRPLKAALALSGFPVGDCAFPTASCSAEDLDIVRKKLEHAGYVFGR